jgi:hypothetical protein
MIIRTFPTPPPVFRRQGKTTYALVWCDYTLLYAVVKDIITLNWAVDWLIMWYRCNMANLRTYKKMGV